MGVFSGRVREIKIGTGGYTAASIICPAEVIPAAGQYFLAQNMETNDDNRVRNLFLKEASEDGFLTAPPVPARWQPGDELLLRGPLGRGFHMAEGVRRVILIALGDTSERLYPLAAQAIARNIDVVLFSRAPLPALPAALEVQPFDVLAEAIQWADFTALDIPLEALSGLRSELGLSTFEGFTPPTQALIHTPMPCGGLGDCGACAVPMRRGWKLACKDGPVFDFNKIDW